MRTPRPLSNRAGPYGFSTLISACSHLVLASCRRVSGGLWLLATQLSELKCVRIGQDSCCSSGAFGFHTAQMLVDWTLDLDSLRSWRHRRNPVNLDCARAVPLFKLVFQPLVVEKLLSQLELPFGQLLPFNARCTQSCSRISLKPLAWTQLD